MTAPNSYRMEESDLDENNRDWSGRMWDPRKIGVDLCSTCDSLIVNGECPECARDAILDLTVTQLTGGWFRSAA